MKALGFNSLKVHPFQSSGFRCQPAPLHLGKKCDARFRLLTPGVCADFATMSFSVYVEALIEIDAKETKTESKKNDDAVTTTYEPQTLQAGMCNRLSLVDTMSLNVIVRRCNTTALCNTAGTGTLMHCG